MTWAAFGFLRGVRDRAIMLELRHRDGRISAVGYAWLSGAEFDPSAGITLSFGGTPGQNHRPQPQFRNTTQCSFVLGHRPPPGAVDSRGGCAD